MPRPQLTALAGLGRRRFILFASLIAAALALAPAQARPGDTDPAFGTRGRAIADVFEYDYGTSIAVGGDGRIVAGGYVALSDESEVGCIADYTFALARFTDAGRADASFDRDGKAVFDFGGGCEFTDAIAVDRNGRVVILGTTFVYPNETYGQASFVVTRTTPTRGERDRTFGDKGGTIIDFDDNSLNFAADMALRPDGRIVVAGATGLYSDIAVAQLRADGKLDTSFGKQGTTVFEVPGAGDNDEQDATAVAIYPDGKVLLAGTYEKYDGDGWTRHVFVARLLANGRLDRAFGTRGVEVTDIGTAGFYGAKDVAIDGQGRAIVVATLDREGDRDDIVVLRYGRNGKLDNSFGRRGKTVFSAGNTDDATSVAADRDGRIIVGGTVAVNADADSDWFVARLQASGALDRNFGKGGKQVTDFGGDDSVGEITALPDGDILAAGTGNTDLAVVKYQGS